MTALDNCFLLMLTEVNFCLLVMECMLWTLLKTASSQLGWEVVVVLFYVHDKHLRSC